MDEILNILSSDITIKELEILKKYFKDNDFNIISVNILPSRALYISNILFINRDRLKESKDAIRFFVELNKFYDSNMSDINVEDSFLKSSYARNLDDFDKYKYSYESPY